MQDYGNSVGDFLENSPNLAANLFKTIGVILVLWIIRILILKFVYRNVDSKRTQYKWRKNLTYASATIGLLLIIQIWYAGVSNWGTFLGLLSAGIAIALKDPVTDIAAWLFILWRKPFDVGDRIQIGESKGDVIDIRPFKFTILEIGNWVHADQSTGRIIHVPNNSVFTEHLANYTSDFQFIWNEIQVMVTFESNWKKAKKILETIVNEESADFVEYAESQVKKAAKSYLYRIRIFNSYCVYRCER
ncbi:MAG: mechanosensitive ion channel domain-containing protein [Balneolaceae bacterium]